MSSEPCGEMVDIVDETDSVIDTVPRSVMRAGRLRHRAVFVAVTDDGGRLLVHRRSLHKDLWPGWCDIAVGGVVSAGEHYEIAARRELIEEVGLDVAVEPIDDGRPRAYDDDHVSLLGRCYQTVASGPLRFDDGEVVDAWWVTREELLGLLGRERFLPDSLALVLPLVRW